MDEWEEIMLHEFFFHNIVKQCHKCKICLPFDMLKYHARANCNDYLGADIYKEDRTNRKKKAQTKELENSQKMKQKIQN